MTPDAETFKHAMRHVPTGVTVVTTLKDGEPRGITSTHSPAFLPIRRCC